MEKMKLDLTVEMLQKPFLFWTANNSSLHSSRNLDIT